jgi:hypothetical protein
MLDLLRLLSALAIRDEIPDAACLAKVLDLDIAQSYVTNTKSLLAIRGARLECGTEVDLVWGRPPHREICLVIAHSSLPYSKIKDEIFGVDQRIVPSRYSAGFGVVFEIDGWECGYTADSPDGDVGFVFCRKPKALGVRSRPQAGAAGMTISNLDGGIIKPD